MLYFNLRNLLAIALSVVSFNCYSGATEVDVMIYNDENFDPRPQCLHSRNPLSSKNNSPCKKTPPTSPSKKGSLSTNKSPVVRKLLLPDEPNVFLGDLDKKQDFAQALSISRQEKAVELVKPKGSYVCALLDEESNNLIESILRRMFQEDIESSSIKEILRNRLPFTVFNLSLKSWASERPYHMSLDGKMTKGMDEKSKERLKSILGNVEFDFSEIKTMKRFIAIKLMDPTVKKGGFVSEDDMKFLTDYLEYDGKIPCMHISLMMVNSAKQEMKCIPIQKGKIENLIPDECIDHKVKKNENIIQRFNERETKEILSKFYLSYLFVTSNDFRSYISKVPDHNKHDLYEDIYNQAKSFQRIIPDFSEIAQLYFRQYYDLNYDFKGKIAICINGLSSNSLDYRSINRLFSLIFLLNDGIVGKDKESFIKFQKATRFYIDSTLYKIDVREKEIENGRIDLGDVENLDFFGDSNQELSEEEKRFFEEKNKSDILKIEELENELTLHLIMNSFFGLSLNMSIFDQLCNEYADLINEVIDYMPGMNARSLDTILPELDKIIPEVIKGNLLHNKYEINSNFCFPDIYNKNIIPYVSFLGNAAQELQNKVHEVKNKEIAELKEFRGNLYEEIEFSSSKIPNPIFWHKFWHILEEKLPKALDGKKFSFNELNVQLVDEEENESIS